MLVVEEDPEAPAAVAEALAEEGDQVRRAGGMDALREVHEEAPDPVVAGIHVPVLGEGPLVRRPRDLNLPVVPVGGDTTRSHTPGVVVVPNPFDPDRLLRVVASLLNEGGGERRPRSGGRRSRPPGHRGVPGIRWSASARPAPSATLPSMTHHRLDPDRWHNALGTFEPVLRVRPGDTLTAATLDARGLDADGAERAARPNPMTGPVWVEGAAPGDALEVVIEGIAPARDWGWTRPGLAPNVVEPETVARFAPGGEVVRWAIDRAAGRVAPEAPPPGLAGLSLPLDPMVGCFGVAPAGGQAVATATSGRHGGNMDWRGFRAGCAVWFPVAVDGALFFLGDGHAVQGDGEIAGTGVETACAMTVTFGVRKGWAIGWPRGEDGDGRFTVGNARPLDGALQQATSEMVRWLGEEGLEPAAAGLLLGQVVRYEIGNVYNPAYTVVCRVPAAFWPNSRA